MGKDGRKVDNSYAVEYFAGTYYFSILSLCLAADLHFIIISHAKDILKIIKTMCLRANNFNNLEKIEDSV